jgi:hypothetical protein
MLEVWSGFPDCGWRRETATVEEGITKNGNTGALAMRPLQSSRWKFYVLVFVIAYAFAFEAGWLDEKIKQSDTYHWPYWTPVSPRGICIISVFVAAFVVWRVALKRSLN